MKTIHLDVTDEIEAYKVDGIVLTFGDKVLIRMSIAQAEELKKKIDEVLGYGTP